MTIYHSQVPKERNLGEGGGELTVPGDMEVKMESLYIDLFGE